MINKQIGKRIRKARQDAGLTLAQVGKHFGLTPQAIETWESGKRAPTAEKVARLADLLEVKRGWLLGEGK